MAKMKPVVYDQYSRKGLSEMTPWVEGFDMKDVSVSKEDAGAKSPKEGDMIARNPKNHEDRWLVAKKYFEDNLELAKTMIKVGKTDKSAGSADIPPASVIFGDESMYKLLHEERTDGHYQKTEASLIDCAGCMVRTSIKDSRGVSTSILWVPGVRIKDIKNSKGEVTGRFLSKK